MHEDLWTNGGMIVNMVLTVMQMIMNTTTEELAELPHHLRVELLLAGLPRVGMVTEMDMEAAPMLQMVADVFEVTLKVVIMVTHAHFPNHLPDDVIVCPDCFPPRAGRHTTDSWMRTVKVAPVDRDKNE